MNPATATCSTSDQVRLRPQRSCSKKISAFAAMRVQRLSHDAYVGDARGFHRVHNGGESAEGHIFVGTDEDGLVLRIADFLFEPGSDLVDVDRVVAQKNALLLVNADHQAFFGNLFHGARFGYVYLNAGLQHRGGDHEDDQQHQNNIHQGRNVDIGERGLSSSVGSRKGHYRGTPGASAVR